VAAQLTEYPVNLGTRVFFEPGNPVLLADVNSRSRSLYAIADPSVCLSVTLVHPTQPVDIFGNFFHHTIARHSSFLMPKFVGGDAPFP